MTCVPVRKERKDPVNGLPLRMIGNPDQNKRKRLAIDQVALAITDMRTSYT